MPIIIGERGGDEFLARQLEVAGVPVIDEASAISQDIRPAKIGLLNLMPAAAMNATEIQWLRWIGREPVLQIEPVLMKFDDDLREKNGSTRKENLKRYKPFTNVIQDGLDGLIITGDNLEIQEHVGRSGKDPLSFQDIRYHAQLLAVIEWAQKNVKSTIYSCLAAHIALNHLYDLPREIGSQKTFGIYNHEILEPTSVFMRDLNDGVLAPHSRWGNIPLATVEMIAGRRLKILAANDTVGWLALEGSNQTGGGDLFLQGHPEYGRLDLHGEFIRDISTGLALPPNYYRNDEPSEGNVMFTWAADARGLHENWIGYIYKSYSQPKEPKP